MVAKKIIGWMMAAMIVVGMTGCGGAEEKSSAGKKFHITIDEAQENRKKIVVTDYGSAFIDNDKVYGFVQDETISSSNHLNTEVLGNHKIIEMLECDGQIVLLDDSGRVLSAKGREYYGPGSTIYNDGNIEAYCDEAKDIFVEDGDLLFVITKNGSYYEKDIIDDTRFCARSISNELAQNSKMVIKNHEQSLLYILQNDGTVDLWKHYYDDVAEATDVYEEIDVSQWKDIECITYAADSDEGIHWLAGLKSDGTLEVTGKGYPEELLEWKDLVDLQSSTSNNEVIGLKSDGTLICSAEVDEEVQEGVQEWKNIKMMQWSGKMYRGVGVSESGIVYLNVNGVMYSDVVYEYQEGGYVGRSIDRISAWDGNVEKVEYKK